VKAADAKRAELRLDVALMRELGVAKWGEIIIGPPPASLEKRELTAEEIKARAEAKKEAEHNILFAASGTRPRLGGPVRASDFRGRTR